MAKTVTYSDNTLFFTDTGVQTNKFTVPLDTQDIIENVPGGETRIVRGRKVICTFDRYTELTSPSLTPPALFTGSAAEDAVTIVDIFNGYDGNNAMVWAVVYSNEVIEYYSDTPFGTPSSPQMPITKDKNWEEITGNLMVTTITMTTIVIAAGAKYLFVKNTGGGTANVTGFGSTLAITAGTNQEIWAVQTDPVNHHYLTSPEATIDASSTTITIIEYR